MYLIKREVETRELQGYKIISGLLDVDKPLLSLNRADFETVKQQQKTAATKMNIITDAAYFKITSAA